MRMESSRAVQPRPSGTPTQVEYDPSAGELLCISKSTITLKKLIPGHGLNLIIDVVVKKITTSCRIVKSSIETAFLSAVAMGEKHFWY
jgi:hypothetical protein